MAGRPRKYAGEKQTKDELKLALKKIYEDNRVDRLEYAKEYYQKNKKKSNCKKTGRKTKVFKQKKMKKGYFWQETSDSVILPRGI